MVRPPHKPIAEAQTNAARRDRVSKRRNATTAEAGSRNAASPSSVAKLNIARICTKHLRLQDSLPRDGAED